MTRSWYLVAGLLGLVLTATAQQADGLTPPSPQGLPAPVPGIPTPRPANPVPLPAQVPPVIAPQPTPFPVLNQNVPLVFDSETKEFTPKPGEEFQNLYFSFTNTSPSEVVISRAYTSCGCTVAKLPMEPWPIAAGATGKVEVSVDLRGKRGQIHKMVFVETTNSTTHATGLKYLNVVVNIQDLPQNAGMDRGRNVLMATVDRQAIFKGECASCHATPLAGKMGAELFNAACGICHDAEHRATMVTDLRVPKEGRNAEYWRTWVTQGKPGSLMAAFSSKFAGPLSDAQVESLVQLLTAGLPPKPTPVVK